MDSGIYSYTRMRLMMVSAYIASRLKPLMLLLVGLLSVAGGHATAVSAQEPVNGINIGLACPSVNSVKFVVATLNTTVVMAIIAIVFLAFLINVFTLFSQLLFRFAELFMERLRFVFDFLLIYALFLFNLDAAVCSYGDTGCATIDMNVLFSQGGLIFRLFGAALLILGFDWTQNTGPCSGAGG